MNPLGLVFLGAFLILAGATAWEAQRGYKSCVCCKPRRRFRSVAERTLDVQGWGAWPTCARKLGLR